MDNQNEQYVYLYRDERGNPRYVGRGKNSVRSLAHGTLSGHNSDLDDWLKASKFSLEICGPFESEDICCTVESALISCLVQTPRLANDFFNKSLGVSKGQFRPAAVPAAFMDRPQEPALTRSDFDRFIDDGLRFLFVYINASKFSDGRKGYDIADIPSDDEIASRSEKYWQLSKKIEGWRSKQTHFPTHLVALSGPKERRFVVGCSEIIRNTSGCWVMLDNMFHAEGMVTVPIERKNLDALGMRGRHLSSSMPIAFNSFRHSVFQLYPDND
ncbi:MAG: hypothetical protein Q8M31_17465 [Beijerinckiaceae bacterium]|nr:hypothetical protein [Beijerinckiaceae bacterium]